MAKIFGTDGIRGQANRYPITPEMALKVGKALGRVGGGKIKRAVIGKDTRLSGYMLETALTSGLVSAGVDVFLIGPMPTPAVAHLTRSIVADIGIALTASHNPFDDNGIKIFNREGFKLDDALEREIERLIETDDLSSEHVRSDALGKAHRIDDARGRYIEFAKGTVRQQDLKGLKIVLDCANGAAYSVAPWIFQELGAEVIKECAAPDGLNINNGCGALHPERIAGRVKETGADLGIALDGDADRLTMCDHEGRVVDGDRIMAILALDYHARGELKGDTLVATTMSNLGLHEALGQHGIRVEVTDVGDRQVIEHMGRTGRNLGGEKSGHIILMDYITTGDGIITALQVLRLMKQRNATLAQLADCMREYPQVLKSLKVPDRRPLEQLKRLQAAIAACRSDLGTHGRTVVRYSGTEPKLRLLVEASESAKVDHWIAAMEQAVREDFGI